MQRLFGIPPAALAFSTLMGCAQPKAPVETVVPPAPAVAPVPDPRLNCRDVALAIGDINMSGFHGDFLLRPGLQNSFGIAHSSAAEYYFKGGTASEFFAELEAGRKHVTPKQQQRIVRILQDIHPRHLEQEELHLLCGDAAMEHVEGLTLDVAEFSIAPLPPVDSAQVPQLLRRHGLEIHEAAESYLGGRILIASDKPQSQHLIIIHSLVSNAFDINGYQQSVERLHRDGVKRFLIPSWVGPLHQEELQGHNADFFAQLERSQGDAARALAETREQHPRLAKSIVAPLFTLPIAASDTTVEIKGVVDPALYVLQHRLLMRAVASHSPHIGRYFSFKAFQAGGALASQQALALAQWQLADDGPSVIHIAMTATVFDQLLVGALQAENLSFIMVEAK